MRGVQEVREIFDGHLVELRCTGVAALPLHLLIYIHGVLGTVAITPTVHPHHVVHSLTARARTHAHAHTHAHTHAQDEHTHTPHALPLCRWHCCHHPQIYLHPHRHRTRTHAHGTPLCLSAVAPLLSALLAPSLSPPPQIPQCTHTVTRTRTLTPHAHAHAHTHTHTHANEHAHTPHALLLCRWHCCHHPQISAPTPSPHTHTRTRHAHAHALPLCLSAAAPLSAPLAPLPSPPDSCTGG